MTSKYEVTIGMEVHAELKTATKMFCASKNDAAETRPNVHICPVCLAHPGTLPVINREAVRHVLRVGIALGGTLADYSEFDRKNYFYPDLPKGYQISQYEYPLVSGGMLNGVEITRVHLEEDTASSIHDDATGATLIDYNRSGVPLMELVTEPVIHSAEEAGAFARELQLLLRTLGVSDANMEQGQMRVEANISIAKPGERGTKVEIKNLNSFRIMEKAVAYEIKRQEEVLERGEKVIQETRGWNENTQQTFAQRTKEGSADYRYFPDPDLPSLKISEIEELREENLRASIPELPRDRRERYIALGVKADDAQMFVRDSRFGSFFEKVIVGLSPEGVRVSANYLANDLASIIREYEIRDSILLDNLIISADNFRDLMIFVVEKKVSSRSAKDILRIAVDTGKSVTTIAEEGNLFQQNDEGAIATVVDSVIEANPSVVADYKSGKMPALEYLVGQSMKQLRGAADAGSLREMIRAKLGA